MDYISRYRGWREIQLFKGNQVMAQHKSDPAFKAIHRETMNVNQLRTYLIMRI